MNAKLPKLETARNRIQEDNERCRVTLWEFAPKTETGWHRHEYDYVVVPVLSGTLTLVEPDGSRRQATIVAGQSYSRRVGVEHNVVNLSDSSIAFVEIEFK